MKISNFKKKELLSLESISSIYGGQAYTVSKCTCCDSTTKKCSDGDRADAEKSDELIDYEHSLNFKFMDSVLNDNLFQDNLEINSVNF